MFIKVLKPVIGRWKSAGSRICMILRKGVSETRKESSSMDDIAALRGDLTKLGLIIDKVFGNYHL